MDALLELFRTGSEAFGARVQAVGESQWDTPTPDTEWTVADLVDHLVEEHRWLPPLLHGLDVAAAEEVVRGSRTLPVHGGVGANYAELWNEAAVESGAAVVEPGVLDRQVELSRGTVPAREYLTEMILDLAVHSWDLGVAIGYELPLPDDLVNWAYEQVRDWGDRSGSGYFAPPVAVPDDAPLIDKVVGATGRDPDWKP